MCLAEEFNENGDAIGGFEAMEDSASNATKVCIGITLVIFFNLSLSSRMLNGLIDNCKWRVGVKIAMFFLPLLLTYWIMVALRQVKILDCSNSQFESELTETLEYMIETLNLTNYLLFASTVFMLICFVCYYDALARRDLNDELDAERRANEAAI